MKRIKKLIALAALGILFVFLVAAEDGCVDDTELDGPAPTAAPEEAAPEEAPEEAAPVEEDALDEAAFDEELAYLDVGADLLDRTVAVMDRFADWSEDTADFYEQEVMFPPTGPGEQALIEAKAITKEVMTLTVPPGYEESHAFWLAAQEELELAFTLAIAGVGGFDVDLIVAGTASMTEATRLIDLATASLPE